MSKLTRGLDAARAVSQPVALRGARRWASAPASKRSLSVQRALEWAFGVEKASIEFDEVNPDAYTVGCDPIWRMMRQAEIGCRVDGGGSSRSADDAEVIASIVARLPAGQGGKGMAVAIASHARAGSAPDWMPGAQARCVPRDGFRLTKHGEFAHTEVVGSVETVHRGRKVQHDVIACPVSFRPSAAQIGAARRAYLDWWGALLHLQHELSTCGLMSIEITSAMPPMTPWR